MHANNVATARYSLEGDKRVPPLNPRGWPFGALAARVRQAFRPPYPADPEERQLSAGIRLLLAVTALFLVSNSPHIGGRGELAVTYGVLIVYAVYAAAILLWLWLGRTVPVRLQSVIPWIDIGVYASLIAVNGWRSAYSVMFFFGIIAVGVRWGFALNTPTTVGVVLILAMLGYVSHDPGTVLDLDHAVLSTAVLLFLILFRAENHRRSRHRLRVLRDIGVLSNPRLGPGPMLARSLECLRAFYDADDCLAVLSANASHGCHLQRATRDKPDGGYEAQEISPSLGATLTAPGETLVYFQTGFRGAAAWTCEPNAPIVAADPSPYEPIAELLGASAYLTVPLRNGRITQGRLYVAATHPAFDRRDMEFLLQAADKIMPLRAHIELVERMATHAAEDERARIALDIHDRLVQPYIGFQIAIESLLQLVSRYPDQDVPATIRKRVAALERLSEVGLHELRGYVKELRTQSTSGGLAESLQRFGRRFHEATGISVTIDCDDMPVLGDRIAAEVLSMACEAVSNVRRHTNAPSAGIMLRSIDDRLVLRVENPVEPGTRNGAFVPRSITERAAALNGVVRVDAGVNTTAVVVEIPS
jgi:signal transduction histidine kinase